MRSSLRRWTFWVVPICLPLLLASSCDDDHSADAIDIIYAIGDVILAILSVFF